MRGAFQRGGSRRSQGEKKVVGVDEADIAATQLKKKSSTRKTPPPCPLILCDQSLEKKGPVSYRLETPQLASATLSRSRHDARPLSASPVESSWSSPPLLEESWVRVPHHPQFRTNSSSTTVQSTSINSNLSPSTAAFSPPLPSAPPMTSSTRSPPTSPSPRPRVPPRPCSTPPASLRMT